MLYSEQAIINLFSWLQCKRKCTILAREDNIYKMNLLFHAGDLRKRQPSSGLLPTQSHVDGFVRLICMY